MPAVAKKRKNKSKSFDEAFDAAIAVAKEANPGDMKVRITVRIDSDIFLELRKRAEAGEGKGMYQRVMNDILRAALFSKKSSKHADLKQNVAATSDLLTKMFVTIVCDSFEAPKQRKEIAVKFSNDIKALAEKAMKQTRKTA